MVDSAQRIVTVWFPDWPVVAAGYGADDVAAVLASNRVVARTAAAAAEGVVIGHRRRQAQRRCPHITLVEADDARDARAFEPVVRAVAELSPRLDVIEPGWIALRARGPSRYFGGDATLAERLAASADSAAGVASVDSADGASVDSADGAEPAVRGCGVGVADGRFASGIAARLAARRGEPVIVDTGGAAAFCAELPVGWLHTLGEVDVELVELFGRLGLRRLGDLAELDAADVLGRFGPPGLHAHVLARGDDTRPASTVDPAPERRLDHVPDDPIAQTSAAVFVAKQLADDLAGALAADGRVCTRLVVELESEHGERSERSWYRAAGLSAAAMVERVRWQLDAWIDLPTGSDHELTGGVALVRLRADEVRADDGVQLGLWGGQSDADRHAARTIARLTTLTSDDAVTVPVWRGGRLPADRYEWVPASTVDLEQRALHPAVAESGPWPGSLPSPSPATVLAEPRPVEVLDGDGHPVSVGGRGGLSAPPSVLHLIVGEADGQRRLGRARAVTAWAGPWPVEQRWWEPGRQRRLARFQLVTDGVDAVLVAAEHQRWWLLARYD